VPGHCADSWFESAILALGDGLGVGVGDGFSGALAAPEGFTVDPGGVECTAGGGVDCVTGGAEGLGTVVNAVQSAPSTESVCTIACASDRLVAVIEERTRS
jgi:hypothetical protein